MYSVSRVGDRELAARRFWQIADVEKCSQAGRLHGRKNVQEQELEYWTDTWCKPSSSKRSTPALAYLVDEGLHLIREEATVERRATLVRPLLEQSHAAASRGGRRQQQW